MSERSFEECERWLTQVIEGRTADPSLLTRDLRYSRLREASPGSDKFGPFIAFRTLDRSARFVTPAQFCFMRFLSLPGGSCAWYFGSDNKKKLPPERKRYYLAFGNRRFGNLYGLRILYDAKPGEVMLQQIKKPDRNHRGHYDLRPHNIRRTTRERMEDEGKPLHGPFYGRLEAINYAVRQFGDGFEHLPIGKVDYRSLLERSAKYLDETNSIPAA